MKLPSIRRCIDVAAGSIGSVVLAAPIAAMAAIARLESGKTGLFPQVRYGLNGEPFEILKIRTLDDNGDLLPIAGKFRKGGLDEWPQIVNVVNGDMSFIGPRPHFRLMNVPGWDHMLKIPPGVIGLNAVVEKEAGVQNSFARRAQVEGQYVDRRLSGECTLSTDMDILLRGLKIAASGRADSGKATKHVLPDLSRNGPETTRILDL